MIAFDQIETRRNQRLFVWDVKTSCKPIAITIPVIRESTSSSSPRCTLLSQAHYTMATTPVTNSEGLKSYKTFLALPPEQTLDKKTLPYASTGSLGIMLQEHRKIATVFATPSGDAIPFNEPKNEYGLKIAGLIVADMRLRKDSAAATLDTPKKGDSAKKSGGKLGERASFDLVLRQEQERLADLLQIEGEPLNDRRLKAMWKVMVGFRPSPGPNVELDAILLGFAKIRLGVFAFRYQYDEFGAATRACQDYYLCTIKDNSAIGVGEWTLPLIHLLNGHMIQRGLTPIEFSPFRAVDEELHAIRKTHNRDVWDGDIDFIVEARENVVKELQDFATEVMGTAIEDPPTGSEKTGEDSDEAKRPAKKHRPLRKC